MSADSRIFFLIRPRDPDQDHEECTRHLEALDEEFTESVTGGVGDYDYECRHVEVWLFDRKEEPLARRIIEKHGFVVLDEEQVRSPEPGA